MGLFQLPGLPELLLRHRLEAALTASGLPPDTARHYQRRLREPGAARAALGWYRAVPLTRLRPRPVPVPTTYVWGRRDPFLGAAAARRTERHVTADYRFVPLDAGHWLPELASEAVAEAVVRRAVEGER